MIYTIIRIYTIYLKITIKRLSNKVIIIENESTLFEQI